MLSTRVRELTLFRAVLPFLASIIVNTFAAPINTFIASGVNSTAIESIGTASAILFLFGVLISLLSGGSGILIAQYIGKKAEDKNLKRATDTAFFVALVQAFILMGLAMSLHKVLLNAWGVKDNTVQMENGRTYILWLAPNFIVGNMIGYFSGTTSVYGRPLWAMIGGIAQTILDITISLLLTLYTNLGILAVIIGTLVANFLNLVFSVVVYSVFVQRFYLIRAYSWVIAKKIINISLPIGVEKVNYNAAQFVQGAIAGNLAFSIGLVIYDQFGQERNLMLQARSIFNSIQALTLIGSVSLGVGAEIVIARQMGQKDFEGVKRNVRLAFFWAISIDLVIALVIFFTQPFIIDLLSTQEKDRTIVSRLKDELYWPFLWLIFLEFGRALNLVYIGVTRAAGDTRFTAIASIPITWMTAVLLSFVLAKYTSLGFQGIVIGMTFDEVIRGVVNYWRYRTGRWKAYIDQSHSPSDAKASN